MRYSLLLAVLGAPVALGAPDDPIKARIEKAKTAYGDEFQKLEERAAAALDAVEAAARKKGDRTALDRLKPERTAFDLLGTLPKGLPASAAQKFTAAANNLVATYAQAVKDYTKAGKDDEAAAAQKELDKLKELEKTKGLSGTRYFYLVNKKTRLVLAAEKEDAARGSHLVQVKQTDKPHQQWWFVPAGAHYCIKNRASGHFVNIPGPAADGAEPHLWDGGGGTNNHLVPVRNGFYYSFSFVDSKKFVAAADTTAAGGKPVIHKEKPEGDVHLWALVPVRE